MPGRYHQHTSDGDTGRAAAEVRSALGDELAVDGGRMFAMLVDIQKSIGQSRSAQESSNIRLNMLERQVGKIDDKLDGICNKVAYLDGEQSGIHHFTMQKTEPPKEGPGLQVTVAQKVLLGGGSAGIGGIIAWLLARLG